MACDMKCKDCKRCNRKGKPSVTKGSKVCCERMVKQKPVGFFERFKKNLMDRFKDKEGNQHPVNGFRIETLKRMK